MLSYWQIKMINNALFTTVGMPFFIHAQTSNPTRKAYGCTGLHASFRGKRASLLIVIIFHHWTIKAFHCCNDALVSIKTWRWIFV